MCFGDRVGSPLFTVDFAVASVVKKFVLIDIDEVATKVQFFFHLAGRGVKSFNATHVTTVINAAKNNSRGEFDVAAIAPSLGDADFLKPMDKFDRISGGVASVIVAPIQVPATLPMMMGALGLLGWAAHRRKAA